MGEGGIPVEERLRSVYLRYLSRAVNEFFMERGEKPQYVIVPQPMRSLLALNWGITTHQGVAIIGDREVVRVTLDDEETGL